MDGLVHWLNDLIQVATGGQPEVTAAWAAAVAAFLAVAASLFMHADSRGRVRTDLKFTWWAPGGVVMESTPNLARGEWSGPVMEFATVGVENPGRNAVTVTDLGLEFRRHGAEKDVTTPMHFITGPDQRFEGYPTVLRRVEPNERHAVIFDLWDALDNEFRSNPHLEAITVRGCARVAGHRRLKRSRNSWTVWRDTVSALPEQRVRPLNMVILSGLVRGRRRLQREPLELDSYEWLHPFSGWIERSVVSVRRGDWMTLTTRIEEELADHDGGPWNAQEVKKYRPWARRAARDIMEQLERLGDRVEIPPHLREPEAES